MNGKVNPTLVKTNLNLPPPPMILLDLVPEPLPLPMISLESVPELSFVRKRHEVAFLPL